MKTTKGKLRNISTGILHTEIGQVYEFFTEFTGQDGIMTHHLGSATKAIEPFLKKHLGPEWFTDEWIKTGLDEPVEIPQPTEDELADFWERFGHLSVKLWDSIKDKAIIVKV